AASSSSRFPPGSPPAGVPHPAASATTSSAVPRFPERRSGEEAQEKEDMRMKRIILTLAAAAALAFAGSAAAAITPWVFDPGNTGCPTSSFSAGVLHLAKNCATTTNASAGASITDVSGQTFTSASFTLPNTGQCQGGSPRFNVVTTNGTTNTTF